MSERESVTPLFQKRVISQVSSQIDEHRRTIEDQTGSPPRLYALTVSPVRPERINGLFQGNNREWVESLYKRLERHLNHHCINHSNRPSKNDKLIRGWHFLETYTKLYEPNATPHTHSIIAVHPDCIKRFETAFEFYPEVYMERTFAGADGGNPLTLTEKHIKPFKDDLLSLLVERMTDLEGWVSYCSKHWKSENSALNPLRGFFKSPDFTYSNDIHAMNVSA